MASTTQRIEGRGGGLWCGSGLVLVELSVALADDFVVVLFSLVGEQAILEEGEDGEAQLVIDPAILES